MSSIQNDGVEEKGVHTIRASCIFALELELYEFLQNTTLGAGLCTQLFPCIQRGQQTIEHNYSYVSDLLLVVAGDIMRTFRLQEKDCEE